MASDTASDAEQNSGPAPGKGPHDIEQLFNAEQNFSLGDPIFSTGFPDLSPSELFMDGDGDLSALFGDIPAGLGMEVEQVAELQNG